MVQPQSQQRRPGRPPVIKEELIKQQEENEGDVMTAKVGHFIVVNTPTIKGVRLNLEKVRTYGKAGRDVTDVQIAWDNGTASTYTFGSEKEAFEFLEVLDSHCL